MYIFPTNRKISLIFTETKKQFKMSNLLLLEEKMMLVSEKALSESIQLIEGIDKSKLTHEAMRDIAKIEGILEFTINNIKNLNKSWGVK